MPAEQPFDLKFISREVTAWGGLALLKCMLDGLDLRIPTLEVWRLFQGRADCESRIKEIKADFGLDSFVLRDLWATEAALGVTMLAYNVACGPMRDTR